MNKAVVQDIGCLKDIGFLKDTQPFQHLTFGETLLIWVVKN